MTGRVQITLTSIFVIAVMTGITVSSSAQEELAAEIDLAVEEPMEVIGSQDRAQRRHLVYELSYTSADRVLGVLKALGYETIEFMAMDGDSPYSKMYDPIGAAGGRLPIIVKMLDAPKTSLMDPDPGNPPDPNAMPQMFGPPQGNQAVPDI